MRKAQRGLFEKRRGISVRVCVCVLGRSSGSGCGPCAQTIIISIYERKERERERKEGRGGSLSYLSTTAPVIASLLTRERRESERGPEPTIFGQCQSDREERKRKKGALLSLIELQKTAVAVVPLAARVWTQTQTTQKNDKRPPFDKLVPTMYECTSVRCVCQRKRENVVHFFKKKKGVSFLFC